jgi:hypothetical protein
VVYLERLGPDGHFHVVREGVINATSTYVFTITFGSSGTKTFRAVVPGGEGNIGGASPAVAVAVSLPTCSCWRRWRREWPDLALSLTALRIDQRSVALWLAARRLARVWTS